MPTGVLGNSAWLLGERFARLAVNLLVGIWIARHLGPEQFGLLSYALAFVAVLSAVAAFGFEAVLVRQFAAHAPAYESTLRTGLILRSCSAAISFVICLVVLWWAPPPSEVARTLILLLSIALFFQSFDVIDYLFQSRLQSRVPVGARVAALVASAAAKAMLILRDAPLSWFGAAFGLEAVVFAFAIVVVARRRGIHPFSGSFESAAARQMLRLAAPVALSSVMVMGVMQIDKLLLAHYVGPREVGFYGIASQLASIWYTLPVVVGASLAPVLVRESVEIQHIYRVFTRIAVVAALAVSLVAQPLVTFLYGEDYAATAPLLALHVWASVGVFHVSLRTRVLIARGENWPVAALSLMTLLLNLALNLLWIPSHGAIGAAAAFVAAWAAGAAVFPWMLAATRPSAHSFFASFRL